MDEYFLSKLIYEPILQQTELTDIESIINAQMPSYTLSKTQKANFCCNDQITNYNTFECSMCANVTTAAQKQQWISETLIDNIKGMYWDPCTRQKLTNDIRLMIKGATCTMPSFIQGRSINDEPYPIPENIFQSLIYKTIQENIQNIELPNSRFKRSFNYSTICNEPDWSEIAELVHSTVPRVKVTLKAFASFSEVEAFMADSVNSQETTRRLAAVDFHTTLPLDYSLRFPPTRMNRPPGYIEMFMSESGMPNQGGDKGINWRTAELKLPMQVTIPRAEPPPACVGGVPYYFTEGFLTVQTAIDSAYTEIETGNDRSDWNTVLKRFVFGKHAYDMFPTVFQLLGPFLMMLATLGLGIDVCKSIVLEKENRTKEYIKTMGGSSLLQWISWWVYYLFIAVLISFAFTVLTTTTFPSKIAFKIFYPSYDSASTGCILQYEIK